MAFRPSSLAWSLCALGLLAVLGLALSMPAPKPDSGIATIGGLGGPFTLTDQDGRAVTEKSWPGQYLLIYFGFTHCPDVCPTGLNRMAAALDALPAGKVAKIQPILITVDPARDDAASLKEYVGLFHPKLVGLTGSEAQIESVKSAFKVYAQKQGDGADYMVNHSAFTYLLAPDGQLAGLYDHEITPQDMSKQINQVVN